MRRQRLCGAWPWSPRGAAALDAPRRPCLGDGAAPYAGGVDGPAMRAILAAALAGLLLAPLAPAAPDAPADDVAALAARLGLSPADLPATVSLARTAWTPAGSTSSTVEVALAGLAAALRPAMEAQATEEPFHGLGVQRSAVGALGSGAGWNGVAFGPVGAFPCFGLTSAHEVELPGGVLVLRLQGALPGGRGVDQFGVAHMDVALQPGPAIPVLEPPVMYLEALAAESTLNAATMWEGCFAWGTTQVAFAAWAGTGDVHTPLERLLPKL
jgi:hypothetical protein